MNTADLPGDYEACGNCGYDHAYEPNEATRAHANIECPACEGEGIVAGRCLVPASHFSEAEYEILDCPQCSGTGHVVLIGAEDGDCTP